MLTRTTELELKQELKLELESELKLELRLVTGEPHGHCCFWFW